MGVESGTAFPEVEFEEGEWVDYDEKVRAKLLLISLYGLTGDL